MKIAVIQKGTDGFFSRFYMDLLGRLDDNKDAIKVFMPNNSLNKKHYLPNQEIWGGRFNWWFHYALYKITGLQDIFSFIDTLLLLRKLKRYNPDIIHLHVVNQCIVNFPLLVRYVNKRRIPVVWTMHDCRAFTGRCSYFDIVNCLQWKDLCRSCPKGGDYHTSFFNNVSFEWKIRSALFNSIKNLVIVTPSQWMASLIEQSFLKEKKVYVIKNGINLSEWQDDVKNESLLLDKKYKYILGVASVWTQRKGLDTFKWLSYNIRDNVKIILVGNIEKKDQLCFKDDKAIFLSKIHEKRKLISVYHQSDVFVNPTLADNFPTTNIEALASGTPVVTYDTGGSAECLSLDCGISVKTNDKDGLLSAINKILDNPSVFSSNNCKKRASFFSLTQFDKYIELYHRLYAEKYNTLLK